jgi:DNA-binding SARP family transcriptional activator
MMIHADLNKLKTLPKRKAGLLLALWGAPGVGKTYTVTQVLSQSGFRFASARANASLHSIAKTLLEALQRHRKAPKWVLSVLGQLERQEYVESKLIIQAITTTLTTLAPFVLHFEDLHEVGAERLTLYAGLARAVQRSARTALLVTSRQKPSALFEEALFEEIQLEPKDRTASAALITRELGSALPEPLIDWIFERAHGNPLFTLEYLRDLQRRGHLTRSGQGWQWSIPQRAALPNTIEVMIEQSLERLSKNAEHTLQGRVLLEDDEVEPLWSAIAQLEPDAFATAKLELEEAGILRGSAFAHPLFKEVALKRLPEKQQRQLITAMLEKIADQNPLLEVRFILRADWDAAKTLELYRKAMELESNLIKLAYIKSAASKYADGDERIAWMLEALETLVKIDHAEATRLAEALLILEPLNLKAIGYRAQLFINQGDPKRGAMLFDQYSGSKDSSWLIHWFSFLMRSGDFLQGYQIWLEHPEIHESLGFGPKIMLLMIMMDQGQTEQVQALTAEMAVYKPQNLSEALNKAIHEHVLLEYRQDDQAILKLWTQLFEQASKEPIGAHHDTIAEVVASAHSYLNDFCQVKRYREIANQLKIDSGKISSDMRPSLELAFILTHQGSYLESERLLLEARQFFENAQTLSSLLECETKLAYLYRYWKPPFADILGLKHARAGLEYARRLRIRRFLSLALMEALLAEFHHGNVNVANSLLEELRAASQDQPFAFLADWAAGLLCKSTSPETALSHFETALKRVNRIGNRILIQLEIACLQDNFKLARELLQTCEKQGFGLGISVALDLFPTLNQTQPVTPKETLLRINTLGSMQILNGEHVIALRSEKRRQLVAILLEAQIMAQAEVSTLELIDALYPELSDEEARKALQQLVFRTRDQLGADSIQTSPTGYALCPVASDVRDFMETNNTQLWRGAYLQDAPLFDSSGFQSLGEGLYAQLKTQLQDVLPNDALEVSRVCKMLLEVWPYDLEVLKLSLRALQQQQNYTAISRLYAKAKKTLLEVGERLPKDWAALLSESLVTT